MDPQAAPAWMPYVSLVFSLLSSGVAVWALVYTARNFRASSALIKIKLAKVEPAGPYVRVTLQVINSGRIGTSVGSVKMLLPRGFRTERKVDVAVTGISSNVNYEGGRPLIKPQETHELTFDIGDDIETFVSAKRFRPYYLPGSRVRFMFELGNGKKVKSRRSRKLTPRKLFLMGRDIEKYNEQREEEYRNMDWTAS